MHPLQRGPLFGAQILLELGEVGVHLRGFSKGETLGAKIRLRSRERIEEARPHEDGRPFPQGRFQDFQTCAPGASRTDGFRGGL